jgi:carboxyl-terminal processing protease
MSRTLLSAFFSLSLLAASLLAPAARAQEAAPLDGVHAAYSDLLDLFYRPVDPRDLLLAGWTALGSDVGRRGGTAPAPLPELPKDADAAFDIFSAAYSTYLEGLPADYTPAMAAMAIENGMADSVHEQHTHYLPPSLMARFLTTVGGGQQAIGLGIRLAGDPPGLIADVAPGSPAAAAGLLPGDLIVGVDGKDVSNTDVGTLSLALVGPAGSAVALAIDRGSGAQTVNATRGPYYFPPLDSRMLPTGAGYVHLSDFVISGTVLPNDAELLADLDRRLDELDAQGAHGLVLDLRNNGGGSLQTADELIGRFVPDTVRSVHESDRRGHESYELASGRMRARQVPMAVLINGGSASASEITAAALRDSHRAIVVGQRSAGAVASSELIPLPGGAGIQIAVAAATGGESNVELDGVGITPDVSAAQSRSIADYRSGRDPQLDAAVAALASAPPPPTDLPPAPLMSSAELDAELSGVLPASGDLPTNDRLTATNRWQRMNFVHPNEVIDQNGGAPDPVALQQTMRSRGYEGSVFASYGGTPGDLPVVTIDVDLYATADGAHAAVSTNDVPALQTPIDAPVQAGDETVAYRGGWLASGSTFVAWRRGRTVFTVTYADAPGFDRPETVAAVAQLLDGRARQATLPQ